MSSSEHPPGLTGESRVAVVVTARNEADRLPDTLAGVALAFPGARVVVADDASSDATAEVASRAGVEVARAARRVGKGGVATLGARRLLDGAGPGGPADVVVLCDGDLGSSAAELGALTRALDGDDCDLAVAVFARRVGGGFGLAVGFARWVLWRRGGMQLEAPLSGQRALRRAVLEAVLPFAPRFAMEVAMTIDALGAGFRVGEIEVELDHRATGRTLGGFAHRARQLADLVLLYAAGHRTRRGGRHANRVAPRVTDGSGAGTDAAGEETNARGGGRATSDRHGLS